MIFILTWLGFKRPASFENQKLSNNNFKSVYPDDQPNENDWMKEFNVSLLHGRNAVHL
jgi:hypothetical protein